MTKILKNIEIVRSPIPALSSLSLKSASAIQELLSSHYAEVRITEIINIEDLSRLVERQPDLVFMGLKFIIDPVTNDKIWISEYLEQHSVAHTGSPKAAIVLEQSKQLAKDAVLNAGLKTSQYMIVHNGKQCNAENMKLTFPLFVKPSNLGAGVGVDENSVVHNLDELNEKISSLYSDHSASALIEEYLSGREFSVAVFKQASSVKHLVMPIELLPGANVNGDRILSYALKSGELETPVAAVADGSLKDSLEKLAYEAFESLGARDYGRIDIRLNQAGVPYFLEANLIPCLIDGSGNFTKACLINNGIDYQTMILNIVNLALDRAKTEVSIEDESTQMPHFAPVAPVYS